MRQAQSRWTLNGGAKRKWALAVAATGAIVLATPVLAQERNRPAPPPRAELFEALDACRVIADNAQRLVCFDSTSASLSSAVDSKQIVVIEEKEVEKTKRSLFGFRLPDLSIFGGNENDREEDKTLVTTVKSLSRADGGRWNIGTPEGAVWQTTEALSINPAVGDALEIKVGMVGGYFLKVRNKRAVRAKRVQ